MRMTPALKAIFEARENLVGCPPVLIAQDFTYSIHYSVNRAGDPLAHGFRGRAKKPAFAHRFADDEARERFVQKWAAARELEREHKTRPERELAPGDVLVSSWGYDQTNINYYLVTALIGRTQIELVAIDRLIKGDGMRGSVAPDPEKITGAVMRRKAHGDRVFISSVEIARKKPYRLVAGVRLYDADDFTSYA